MFSSNHVTLARQGCVHVVRRAGPRGTGVDATVLWALLRVRDSTAQVIVWSTHGLFFFSVPIPSPSSTLLPSDLTLCLLIFSRCVEDFLLESKWSYCWVELAVNNIQIAPVDDSDTRSLYMKFEEETLLVPAFRCWGCCQHLTSCLHSVQLLIMKA